MYNLWLLWRYRQNWAVETEALWPAKPNIFTSSSFREKNLTAPALIPCDSAMRLKNRYHYLVTYLKGRIWGSTPEPNQNLHCNMIPKWDSMTQKPGKHCHGVFPDDRNTHALHWCKFHPTPSYQHRNSKQWTCHLSKIRITYGASKKHEVLGPPSSDSDSAYLRWSQKLQNF